jgi:hypothetical protein
MTIRDIIIQLNTLSAAYLLQSKDLNCQQLYESTLFFSVSSLIIIVLVAEGCLIYEFTSIAVSNQNV